MARVVFPHQSIAFICVQADERYRKNHQGSPQTAPPKQPPVPPRSSEPYSNGNSSSESSSMHKPMEPQVNRSLAFLPLMRYTICRCQMTPWSSRECALVPFRPLFRVLGCNHAFLSHRVCALLPPFTPSPTVLFPSRKVQWSHLASLKNNASAPPVSRSHSFSDPVPSFAHLHLRSQEQHHSAHPARSEHPHPLPYSQSRSHETPETSVNDEVPPKVRAGMSQ